MSDQWMMEAARVSAKCARLERDNDMLRRALELTIDQRDQAVHALNDTVERSSDVSEDAWVVLAQSWAKEVLND